MREKEGTDAPVIHLVDLVADIAQDLHVAMRRMQRAPALTIAIILTITLGLSVAAAIFTVADAALVEPLPYAEPEGLAHLWEMLTGTEERSPTSYPTLLDWRSRVHSFSTLEGYDPTNLIVGVDDEARMLRGAQVTGSLESRYLLVAISFKARMRRRELEWPL